MNSESEERWPWAWTLSNWGLSVSLLARGKRREAGARS
jgi:hypothetical protein